MLNWIICLLVLAAAAEGKDVKKTPAAKVTITAELACLHCTFGEGEGCAVCLKVNDDMPVVLEGKAADQFMDLRLSQKVVVVEGKLSINTDKRLVLTSANAHLYSEKDKEKAPAKGETRMKGTSCCGNCTLKICKDCTLAILNAHHPVILDGKLAGKDVDENDGKTITASGRLFIDKNGFIRLDAKKVEFEKK